jgi:hypothetical protein
MWPRTEGTHNHGSREQSGSGLVKVLLDQIGNLFLEIRGVIQTRKLERFKSWYGRLQEKLIRQVIGAGHDFLLLQAKPSEQLCSIYRTVIIYVNIPCAKQIISPIDSGGRIHFYQERRTFNHVQWLLE